MSVGEEKLIALGYERTGWEEETYFGKDDMVQFNAKRRYVYIENGMSEGVDISMEEVDIGVEERIKAQIRDVLLKNFNKWVRE